MQNNMDNYLRDLARSCAKEAFEEAREKASRSDFMGINSRKVAKVVVNNRRGADEYGMFRSDGISELNQDNCFLGNIFGLSTCPLRKWEKSKSRDPEAYRTILKQYAGMISSNAKAAQVIQKET